MIYLKNDYSEGAHPRVLSALIETNLEATTSYGEDEYCAKAAAKIKKVFACPDADVHFLVGGTQTNQTALSAFLRPWEAAVGTELAHIATHETGSIEATGHKVLTAHAPDGLLTPAMVEEICSRHESEHMVKPKILYISDSTEVGTIYHKAELAALSECAHQRDMYLYLDGARLASALTSPENDIAPEDLAKYCDAFYVGGTKNGALFGEALVLVNDALKPDFRYGLKQHGGMLAKGRLLGVQFDELFTDGLWFTIAGHANKLAKKLQDGIVEKGYSLLVHSPSNQIFPIFPDALVKKLAESFAFEEQGAAGEGLTCIRLVTSWATKEDAVDAFLAQI